MFPTLHIVHLYLPLITGRTLICLASALMVILRLIRELEILL